MERTTKCMTALAIGLAALGTGAAEPVWPADFDAKLAANIADATPAGSQIGTSAGTVAVTMRDWGQDASPGYGTPEDPFDSIWRSVAFSELGILNTKKPRGITLNFR